MAIGLLICASPLFSIIFPNSLIVIAHIIANSTENGIGPLSMHPTNTATKTVPVKSLIIKFFFMV